MPENDLEDMFSDAMAESADADNLGADDVVNTDETSIDEIPNDSGDEIEIDPEMGDDGEEAVIEESASDDAVGDDSDFDFGKIVEEYGDREIPLTVQGEQVMVPLKDLPSMAMMQQDYTRKTQQLKSAADWALQVREGLAKDPQSVLQAFAEAYGVEFGASQPSPPEATVDPYEDLDPDVAAVLRAKDAQLEQAFNKLNQIESTQNNIVMKETQAEVRREFEQVKSEFPEVPPEAMLKVATAYNMPLHEAATLLEGKRLIDAAKTGQEVSQEASKIVGDAAATAKKQAKKQATSAGRRQHKAGSVAEISTDDFSDIGELLEMAINTTQ